MTQSTYAPFDVQDAAEAFSAVPHAVVEHEHHRVLEEVYVLRGVFAWAAKEISRALTYKGFSRPRRPFGEAQSQYLLRAALGDAAKVHFERQSHHVEAAARRFGVPVALRDIYPDFTGAGTIASTTQAPDDHAGIRLAYSLREMLDLRQLAAYEARVAAAHDIPSGPKGVRNILTEVEATLLAASEITVREQHGSAHSDLIESINIPGALRQVDATDTLALGKWLLTLRA
ncbi:hypothetical protein [Microbacterium sp. 77mftsu3.1]|uniref:hypothetical protein n=1 Tax=Microbacterium sp. 77mftsu3.1 TaxID=1761802 RepID=UPI00037629B4|nr:hypothetical protein [Microbacterium sp. 77mftsu3.1]SDH56017.1 hypothetical protein SAMN04488590_3578 [Microbacterium sp. 77mftsu3.1]